MHNETDTPTIDQNEEATTGKHFKDTCRAAAQTAGHAGLFLVSATATLIACPIIAGGAVSGFVTKAWSHGFQAARGENRVF